MLTARRCNLCDGPVTAMTVRTTVRDAVPVSMFLCPSCDRRKCSHCHERVMSPTAVLCPRCGAPVGLLDP